MRTNDPTLQKSDLLLRVTAARVASKVWGGVWTFDPPEGLSEQAEAEARLILRHAAQRLLAERVEDAKRLYLEGTAWETIEASTGLPRAAIEGRIHRGSAA